MVLDVRRMTRADLEIAVGWAAAEGWNPGHRDADAFFEVDPRGFLIGVLDGEPVASISVVRYDHGFGFLGFYIVAPAYRGAGHGLTIWNAGMAYLGGCNVGLDGVVAQQENYRQSGFRYAYGNVRHEGRGGGTAPTGVVNAADVPLATILAYDTPRFPVPRPGFVRSWLTLEGHRGFAVPGDDGIRGYCVLRPCRTGFKLGPLFADDEAIADRLFRAAAASVPGEPLFLDTPSPNAAAVALARRHGMSPVFETARMYTGPEPEVDLASVFGVTSFELG